MPALNELSAVAAARAIASGEATSEAVVAACLERITARELDVGAWTHLDSLHALEQARARDRETRRGPLHGVPIGVKDVFDTFDMPTGMGSLIYAGHRPRADAAVVSLARAAGAVIMGKTVTTEFAAGGPGKTRNPHNPSHTPGGSSSGSAAAVADRMVPLAFGTQTAGSVIRPASFCGVIGFKPSYGVYARAGVKPLSETLDTVGYLCRDLADIELLDAVLTGRANAIGARLDRAPCIAFCPTHLWSSAGPVVVAALEDAAARLAKAGARVETLTLPDDIAALTEAHQVIMTYEVARSLHHEWTGHRDRLGAQIAGRIERGLATPFADYTLALAQARAARRTFRDLVERFDAILTPCAPGEAPEGLKETGDRRFQSIWTLLHAPCVALPTHRGAAGLPVGIQLVGRLDEDMALIASARWVWDTLRPA